MRVHNVFRVLMRDLKRIAKAPASWVVILVLITLPSLYTWFNVVGFWNPYNNTGALKVCVVNEDEDAHNDLLGDLQLGDQIVDQLHENTQLNWEFTDYDDAMAKISSGEAYAAFVIPSDFSEDMTTLLTGEFQRPQLEYYVNEKLNPVAPKITDTGASTLDNTINDTFVSTVSSVVAETLNDKIAESQESFDASKAKVSTQIDKVDANLSDARESVSGLSTASSDAIAQANSAKASLSDARREIGDMALALSEASALAATLNTEIVSFSGNMSTAISGGLSTVSAASTRANGAVGDAATGIQAAQGDVEYATSVAQNVIDGNKEIISYLQAVADDTHLTQDQRDAVNAAIATLSQSNANAEANLKSMNALAASASRAAGSIANASSTVNDAVQKSVDNGRAYNDDLSKNTIPAVNQGLSGLASTAGSLSGAVARQTSLIDQTSLVLDQLISTLNTTVDALGQTDALLADVQGDIDTVRTDVVALGTSGALAKLFGEDGTLDVNKIADFMQSPTQLETEQLYPLNAYGSAMSPLFINLTLWIGVFMLMVIMHIEVDDEEIRNLTIAQRFLGRGILFAIMVSLQAIVCVTGCLFLGVQAENVAALYITAVACSLTYLAIQYTLSTTLQHVGKGLCVILVFVQIPGATGLYPVELTTSFFQTVYPIFPFTYGINAMRECICGFYGNMWLGFMGVLALFFAVFLLIGTFARPFLTNLNRMFAKQLAESDIVNCEEVQLPERRYRTAQIVRAMSNHEEFRAYLLERSTRFMRLYPKLKHGAYALGVVVPVLFTASMALWSPGKKVVVLTVWLLWLIAVVAFLIIVEHMKDSLERQIALNAMSDEELRTLFAARDSLEHDPCIQGGEPAVGYASSVAVGPESAHVRVPVVPAAEPVPEPIYNADGESGSSDASMDVASSTRSPACDDFSSIEVAPEYAGEEPVKHAPVSAEGNRGAEDGQAPIADSSNAFASAFGAAESEYDEPVDGFNEPADDFDMGDDAPKGTRGVKGGDAR